MSVLTGLRKKSAFGLEVAATVLFVVIVTIITLVAYFPIALLSLLGGRQQNQSWGNYLAYCFGWPINVFHGLAKVLGDRELDRGFNRSTGY